MHIQTNFAKPEQSARISRSITQYKKLPMPNIHIEPQEKNPLSTVTEYYLNPLHLPRFKQELPKQFALFFVCVTGAPLYITPADQYAIDQYGERELTTRAAFIIGTTLPALLVLYNATDRFLSIRASQKAPEELSKILINPYTYRERLAQDLVILFGSALSAVPLMLVTLRYPLAWVPEGVTYALAVAAEIDNTVLHFLPIQLALQQQIFRLPIQPIEIPYRLTTRLISRCLEDESTKEKKRIEAKRQAIFADLKGRVMGAIMSAKNNLAINGMEFDANSLSYKPNVTDEISELVERPAATLGSDKLDIIADYQVTTPALAPPNDSLLWERFRFIPNTWARVSAIANFKLNETTTIGRAVDFVLRKASYVAGGFWVASSCSGYLAATYDGLTDMMGDEYGAALAVSPMYFLSVLFVFYGGNSLEGIYDYATSWGSDKVKIPLEFKLYPKTAAGLMLFALVIASVSYGAACTLIKDGFADEKWDEIRPTLYGLAESGVPFISFMAMRDFYLNMLNKFAMYFGGSEEQMVIKLNNMFEALVHGISMMPGELLVESLNKMDHGILTKLLKIEPADFKRIYAEVSTYTQAVSPLCTPKTNYGNGVADDSDEQQSIYNRDITVSQQSLFSSVRQSLIQSISKKSKITEEESTQMVQTPSSSTSTGHRRSSVNNDT
jgi:hypothetical protein